MPTGDVRRLAFYLDGTACTGKTTLCRNLNAIGGQAEGAGLVDYACLAEKYELQRKHGNWMKMMMYLVAAYEELLQHMSKGQFYTADNFMVMDRHPISGVLYWFVFEVMEKLKAIEADDPLADVCRMACAENATQSVADAFGSLGLGEEWGEFITSCHLLYTNQQFFRQSIEHMCIVLTAHPTETDSLIVARRGDDAHTVQGLPRNVSYSEVQCMVFRAFHEAVHSWVNIDGVHTVKCFVHDSLNGGGVDELQSAVLRHIRQLCNSASQQVMHV